MERQDYIDNLLDHYEHPRNRHAIEHAAVDFTGGNPGCGDIIRMFAAVDDDGRVTDVSFEGEGCTISQAAASIITEIVPGKTMDEVAAMTYEDLIGELGKDVVSTRVKCATLALGTLKAGVKDYQDKARLTT